MPDRPDNYPVSHPENYMTELSRRAYELARDNEMSPAQAVSYLKDDLPLRSVSSKLAKFYKGEDLEEFLKIGFQKNIEEMENDIQKNGPYEDMKENDVLPKKDSMRSRAKRWMQESNYGGTSREDTIEAAYVLGLSLEDADKLMMLTSDSQLHWRDANEIAYIFGLQNKMTYAQARRLASDLLKEQKELDPDYKRRKEAQEKMLADHGHAMKFDPDEDKKKVHKGKNNKKPEALKPNIANNNDRAFDGDYSVMIQKDVEKIHSTDDIKKYVRNNYRYFGIFHNRAYTRFSEMKDVLKNSGLQEQNYFVYCYIKEHTEIVNNYLDNHGLKVSDIQADGPEREKFIKYLKKDEDFKKYFSKVTNREILETGLYYDIIRQACKRGNKLSDFQKNFVKLIPDESQLSKIDTRASDVSRKTLILLYLITLSSHDKENADDDSLYSYDMDYDIYYANNNEDNQDADSDDEMPIPDDEMLTSEDFAYNYEGINTMLSMCGYSTMDPRNPFDWVILYCIRNIDEFDFEFRDMLGEILKKEKTKK